MTKKEKVAHDAEITRMKLRLALRWTDGAKPDLFAPSREGGIGPKGEKLTKGWFPVGGVSSHARIEPACSSCIYHSLYSSDKTTTQGPLDLYGSRLLALKAMRHNLETEAAQFLMKIDEEIEREMANPTPLPPPSADERSA